MMEAEDLDYIGKRVKEARQEVIAVLEEAYKKYARETWCLTNFEKTKPYLPKWAREALAEKGFIKEEE